MEFFDRIDKIGKGGKKSLPEKAAQLLSKLDESIAAAPDAIDLEVDCYSNLYVLRVDKARRAYAKAVKAMADGDHNSCMELAERGLLHLQIADVHAHTTISQLQAAEVGGLGFSPGGPEECIQHLADAICRIKMLAEYKNLELSKELRNRLASIVQNLQDAIEAYGNGQPRAAFDTALGGIVWCQYIHARLGGDALFSPKQQTKTIRTLYKLAWDLGHAAADPVCRLTEEGRKKVAGLEEYLQSAMNGYFDDTLDKLENFARLAGIEATSLIRYVARVKTKDLVAAMQSTEPVEKIPRRSIKQMIAEIRDLIDRHHPDPDRALVSLESLHYNFGDFRRARKTQSWRDARRDLDACRYETENLRKEANRLSE